MGAAAAIANRITGSAMAGFPFRWLRPARISAATSNATDMRPASNPLTPPCRHNSHRQAAAVSAIGTARMRWSVAIHAPGLGSSERSAGMKAMAMKGSARPSPSAANTAIDPAAGSNKAVPKAAPRKGPAQGVATNAAKAPVPKLPVGFCSLPMTGSSNTRSRLSVMAVASKTRMSIVRGSCNWNAQPAAVPLARIASRAAPSALVPATAPAA